MAIDSQSDELTTANRSLRWTRSYLPCNSSGNGVRASCTCKETLEGRSDGKALLVMSNPSSRDDGSSCLDISARKIPEPVATSAIRGLSGRLFKIEG